MTGHEFELNVSPNTKVKEVSDMALARVSGADAKRAGHSAIIASLKSIALEQGSARASTATSSLRGERLAPSATLADYQVFDGALLHLILDPIDAPDGVAQAPAVERAVPSRSTTAPTARTANSTGRSRTSMGSHALAQPATLYARCGGVFGVAGFVDVCMDAWMAEPTLNANEIGGRERGTRRAQRCGFKFLVTQLISYQCGGPQVYTGREMAASHKHLSISPEEWAAFIDSLHEVCDELGLPKQETDDVAAVVASMRAGCTLAEGEEAPPNPGPPPPSRCLPTSLYARLGGCYPLALFSDRLVDALLGDSSVVITVSDERTMPALKYLFTELCCEIAGGPEVMTAPSLHTARLQLRPLDFVKMLGCVKSAADHLDDDADVAARHAAELAQASTSARISSSRSRSLGAKGSQLRAMFLIAGRGGRARHAAIKGGRPTRRCARPSRRSAKSGARRCCTCRPAAAPASCSSSSRAKRRATSSSGSWDSSGSERRLATS